MKPKVYNSESSSNLILEKREAHEKAAFEIGV